MHVAQERWDPDRGWTVVRGAAADSPGLVLVFGGRARMGEPALYAALRDRYPGAVLVGCSTAGEICGAEVSDDAVVVTALSFAHTRVRAASVRVAEAAGSRGAGALLARALRAPDLAHVLVFSDGLRINGSALTAGLRGELPGSVAVTGGLSGDGDRFQRTLVCAGGPPEEGLIAAVGLYGDRLRVGFGSLGGWDSFGPDRVITRAAGNVLYELDGQSALELYKLYLGEHARGLPASGLLFPLSVLDPETGVRLTRTILGVDEASQSLTFAGDLPVGHHARLMRANFERLIDGAHGAAVGCLEPLGGVRPDFALLISCVGRKLVLGQRVEEEVEAVREVIGLQAVTAGFYSYGEISPAAPNAGCELHNQTMTITALREV